MNRCRQLCEHGELLVLPDGRVLAHNITPEVAAVLAEIAPNDELMAQRAASGENDEDPGN
jgi:hypothetical protein